MDDISHVRNSPEHLLRMLGVDDNEKFFLYRPYGPDEWSRVVRLTELEHDVCNRWFAFLFRTDEVESETVQLTFIDFDGKQHRCISIDFDCTVSGGVFFFGFYARDGGYYWMQPKDMREYGFHLKPDSDARRAVCP